MSHFFFLIQGISKISQKYNSTVQTWQMITSYLELGLWHLSRFEKKSIGLSQSIPGTRDIMSHRKSKVPSEAAFLLLLPKQSQSTSAHSTGHHKKQTKPL